MGVSGGNRLLTELLERKAKGENLANRQKGELY